MYRLNVTYRTTGRHHTIVPELDLRVDKAAVMHGGTFARHGGSVGFRDLQYRFESVEAAEAASDELQGDAYLHVWDVQYRDDTEDSKEYIFTRAYAGIE